MSNVVKSYEGVLAIIKKHWCANLRLNYVPADYEPIILNTLGELLSIKKFKFVRSFEPLLEPIEIKINRTVVVVLSMPLLNHFFNQPLILQDNPVEFITNANPLKALTSVSVEESSRYDGTGGSRHVTDTVGNYSRYSEHLLAQYASPRQRYIIIQMMRIALLVVHVQHHYLNKRDTPDHQGFHALELAERVSRKRPISFYDDEEDDEDDDGEKTENENIEQWHVGGAYGDD